MSRAVPKLAAWAMAVTAVSLIAAGLAIRAAHADPTLPGEAASRAVMLAFAATGLVVALARPSNAIGWLLSAIALTDSAERFGASVIVNEPSVVTAHPAAGALVAVVAPASALIFVWLILIAVTFPSGGLPGTREKLLAGISAALCLAWIALAVIRQGPIDPQASPLPNPLGFVTLPAGVFETAATMFFVSQLLLLSLAVASLVRRFGRSRGAERQQMKWLVTSMTLMAGYLGVFSVIAVISEALGARMEPGSPPEPAVGLGFWAVVLTVPVSIAVAILRYRLYEIDVLIRRTLVYGALTLLLAVTYLGLLVVVQAALRPFTAGSDVAVAASTLATLALVQPLRVRIRDAVDRRFYRSRYDAARTLDAFSTKLRDQVDLDAVRGEILEVVAGTVRPAHANVWLR